MRLRFRSLRGRLLAAFLAVALAPLALVAGWSLVETRRTVERLARTSLLDEGALAAVELEKAINRTRSDLFQLSQIPSLRRLSRPVATPEEQAAARAALAVDLARVLAPARVYAGAAYLDLAGDEQVRVTRAKEAIQIVPASGLRHLGRDPFVGSAAALASGQLLIGTLATEDPMRPAEGTVVRFLAGLFDDEGVHRGTLGLDLRIHQVAGEVRRKGVTAAALVIIDPRGAYIEDPRPPGGPLEPAWRQDLADRFPALRGRLDRPHPQIVAADDDTLLAVHPVEVGGFPVPWRVVTVRPRAEVLAPVRRALGVFASVLLLALVLGFLLARLIADRVSRPLLLLAREAAELGRGRFDQPLHVRTGDEVEALAGALERMRGELQGLYRGLEERIADKTRELVVANEALRAAYVELETAHRRLQESEAELIESEKLSSIGRLAASVAHEINNPTGIISMYAQLLREEASDAGVRETLDRIVESAEKVSRTVKDLLASTRRAPLAAQPVRLEETVANALREVRALGAVPGPAVDLAVAADAVVLGDPFQLAQVFRNLIENAAHAAGAGGRLCVRARREQDEIEVEVEDSGPGIPAEVLPRIFEPFFTTKSGTGTGLGLFVAWGIVRSHRGSIRAENPPGGGARFVLRLPAASL